MFHAAVLAAMAQQAFGTSGRDLSHGRNGELPSTPVGRVGAAVWACCEVGPLGSFSWRGPGSCGWRSSGRPRSRVPHGGGGRSRGWTGSGTGRADVADGGGDEGHLAHLPEAVVLLRIFCSSLRVRGQSCRPGSLSTLRYRKHPAEASSGSGPADLCLADLSHPGETDLGPYRRFPAGINVQAEFRRGVRRSGNEYDDAACRRYGAPRAWSSRDRCGRDGQGPRGQDR
jgi:hypothetical protein